MALDAYQNGNYSLCLRLLHLQNHHQQQQLSVQHRQLQLMAQIGHFLKTHPTPTTTHALTAAWANLLGISLPYSTTTTPPSSPSFILSQHRKLAALLHPDKNHYKDASLRFTQLQKGVEMVLQYLSFSSSIGGASQSHQHFGTSNDDQELDDSWVNDSDDGGSFPWWSRWDDDGDDDREEEGEGEGEEKEDMRYLKSLTHEELKQEVVKRREDVLFDKSRTIQSRLARGRAVLTNALQQTAAADKESEQQLYGGFFPF